MAARARFLVFLASLASCAGTCSMERQSAAPQRRAATIERVVDGDTVVLAGGDRVRLVCVDTPESVHPDKKRNVAFGKVAAQYTASRLPPGTRVELEDGRDHADRFRRELAYVYVGGVNLNLELVSSGYSPYYTKYGLSCSYHEQFVEAERGARREKKGIWADPELARVYLNRKSQWGRTRKAGACQ